MTLLQKATVFSFSLPSWARYTEVTHGYLSTCCWASSTCQVSLWFCTQVMSGQCSSSLYNARTSTTWPFPRTYAAKALATLRPTFLQRSSPYTTASLSLSQEMYAPCLQSQGPSQPTSTLPSFSSWFPPLIGPRSQVLNYLLKFPKSISTLSPQPPLMCLHRQLFLLHCFFQSPPWKV